MKASPPEDSVFTLFPLLLSFTSEVKPTWSIHLWSLIHFPQTEETIFPLAMTQLPDNFIWVTENLHRHITADVPA